VLPRGGEVRLNPEAGSIVPDSLFNFPLQAQGDRQVAVGVGISRVDFDDSCEVADGFVELIARSEQHRQVEMRISIVGIEAHCPPKFSNRIVSAPGSLQKIAEIEAHSIVIRLEANSLTKMLRCFGQTALELKDAAQITVCLGVVWLESQRCGQLGDGIVYPAGLQILRRQVIVSRRVIRIGARLRFGACDIRFTRTFHVVGLEPLPILETPWNDLDPQRAHFVG
jgi:hypothetical protein